LSGIKNVAVEEKKTAVTETKTNTVNVVVNENRYEFTQTKAVNHDKEGFIIVSGPPKTKKPLEEIHQQKEWHKSKP